MMDSKNDVAPLLSILIPAYNEAYTIAQVVGEVMQAALPIGMRRELVVVDDASCDGTAEVLQDLVRQYPVIKYFRHEHNQGKGAAIRSAIREATGDYIVIQDADLEYNPAEYSRLLAPLLSGDADVVYGSRFLSSECRRVLYFWHSVGNRILTVLSNMLTNLNLTDMETCYKMGRAEIFKSLPIRCNRFGIEPELTAKFAKRGCRIYEVPVSYRGRTYQEGKKVTWWDGCKAFFVMFYFHLVDDLYNDKYGHAILHCLFNTRCFNRWMTDAIKPWIGKDVMEIGAGMGNLSRHLIPRRTYVASDIDPLHLSYLANIFKGNDRVKVARIDVAHKEDVAAYAGRFDTVVCLNVLEHVADDHTALINMRSMLVPGGQLCLLVPQMPKLYGSMDQVLGHCRRYTKPELRRQLEAAGFEVVALYAFNRVSVPGWWWHGKIMRNKEFSKWQLKIFDLTVWLWRRIDCFLPWPGLSLVAIGRKAR